MSDYGLVPSIQSQAQEANHSGMFLQDAIEGEFSRRRVLVEYWRKDIGDVGHLFHDKCLLKNVPYTSIYGAASRSEFVYLNQRVEGLRVRIECRWQQEPGSVDEKLPYLFLNAVRVTEPYVWLVIDGGGARDKALRWIKREARACTTKAVRVYTLTEARSAIKRLVEQDKP
jgi:hypothetical protein